MDVVNSAMSIPASELMNPQPTTSFNGSDGSVLITASLYQGLDIASVERGPVTPKCDYRQGAAGLRCGKTNNTANHLYYSDVISCIF